MVGNVFDLLRQKARRAKKFDELPNMDKAEGDDSLNNFNIVKFKEDTIECLRKNAIRAGEKMPEYKVVGVSLHLILLNPNDPTREQIAHSQATAWHKDCGNTDNWGPGGGCDDGCDGNCNHNEPKKPKANEEQEYKPGRYDGHMFN